MKITVINGTNRIGNKTLSISKTIREIAQKTRNETYLVTLDNFDKLFRGEYIKMDNASDSQKEDMQNMIDADILLFVVPTYHSSIPSPLKNFLDTIAGKEIYDHKLIGLISVSDKNQDLGARQAAQTLNGILSYLKVQSFVVPRITTLDFDEIDKDRIEDFIHYCSQFINRSINKAMFAEKHLLTYE